MRSLHIVTLAVSGIVLSSATVMAGIDFAFSFTNTTGTVSGTVTGEITGLRNNAASSATQVLIESFPPGSDSLLGTAPIDATTWSNQIQNQFTVTDGQVTGGTFWAYNINQVGQELVPKINEALLINALQSE